MIHVRSGVLVSSHTKDEIHVSTKDGLIISTKDKFYVKDKDYLSLSHKEWCNIMSALKAKDDCKMDSSHTKRLASQKAVLDSDSSARPWVPRKKKARTGFLLDFNKKTKTPKKRLISATACCTRSL